MAGVYNATAGTLDIYVNGVQDNGTLSGTVPASQVVPALNPTIGKRPGGFYFNGVIDNLRIYNRALSAAEIVADMSTPVGATGTILPTMTSLQCSRSSIASSSSSVCTVTLSQAAPVGGSTVVLSDNSAVLAVPTSVLVAAGAITATLNATTGAVPSDQTATVTATLNGVSQTATLNLVAPVALSSLACNPTSLGSSATSTCTVTLSKAAPTGGTVVMVSDNNALLGTPASVTVAAGFDFGYV